MIKFFKQLKEIIEKNEKVIIVGHKNPDLDCIAASIGLYKVISNTILGLSVSATAQNDVTYFPVLTPSSEVPVFPPTL